MFIYYICIIIYYMIIDSSTLILLAKSGLLDLFIENKKLIITDKVKEESISAKDSFDAKLISQRIGEGKIQVKKIKNIVFYNKLIKEFNLGKGEAETITLAFTENSILLSDDKKAINTCKILNIKFATALNILVRLYKNKIINNDKAEIILRKLKKYGRYSEELIKKVQEDLKWEKYNLLWL